MKSIMSVHHWVRGTATVAAAALLVVSAPYEAAGQTMPGPVYNNMMNGGYEKLAKRLSKKLDLRSDPDDSDVEDFLERWTAEEGGPDTGYEWLAVTRLWLRAGNGPQAELALHNAEGRVPAGLLLLDQARVAFLTGQTATGNQAYWKGCELADQTAAIEYWIDIESLATPSEIEAWDRFRRLPSNQTDMCAFLQRFWGERALASTLSIAARIDLHYDRTRYALDNYRRRGGKKGPVFSTKMGRPVNAVYDDRGLLFLRIGDPDRMTSFAGNPSIQNHDVSAECFQPNQSWAYDYPDGTKVYHFTTGGGTDDWWLIDNLGLVYRCGDPNASGGGVLSPVNQYTFANLGASAYLVLKDLYQSRQGLDPRYARMAQNMYYTSPLNSEQVRMTGGSGALEGYNQLQKERDWTHADARFAIHEVPERPDVAPGSRLLVEDLQFRSPKDRANNRVWLNSVVEAQLLTPIILPDSSYRYRVQARWAVLGDDGTYQRFQTEVEAFSDRPLGADESLPVRIHADLPPGHYEYNVLFRDVHRPPGGGPRQGNYFKSDLVVQDFGTGTPAMSDIAVAADSGGSWSPSPNVALKASPTHTTGMDGVGYIYFEAYNLTPGGRYTTTVRLEPRDDDDGDEFTLTYAGDVGEGNRVAKRVLRLDLDETAPGPYGMEITVKDEESGRSTLPYTTEIIVQSAGS